MAWRQSHLRASGPPLRRRSRPFQSASSVFALVESRRSRMTWMSSRYFSSSRSSTYRRAHPRLTTSTGFRYCASRSAQPGQIVFATSGSSRGSFTPRSIPHHAQIRRKAPSFRLPVWVLSAIHRHRDSLSEDAAPSGDSTPRVAGSDQPASQLGRYTNRNRKTMSPCSGQAHAGFI
jgi:hypothetical protein